MVSWQAGRFITDWADPSEVGKVLALLPVREAGTLSAEEQLGRRLALYNAFGIDAVAHEHGIEFTRGVDLDDQPLVATLDVLLDRRFPSSSSQE